MTERVRVELRRSGGFAGRLVQVRLDSADLPPAEAARLVRLVSAIDFSGLPRSGPSLPVGADLMTYELSIERGRHSWKGTVSDPSIPAGLRPLLQFLTTRS